VQGDLGGDHVGEDAAVFDYAGGRLVAGRLDAQDPHFMNRQPKAGGAVDKIEGLERTPVSIRFALEQVPRRRLGEKKVIILPALPGISLSALAAYALDSPCTWI